jgi:hypothetical protein
MDGESEAHTQRAEAWRAEANVKREGVGSHEPVRIKKRQAGRLSYMRQAEARPT